MGEQIDFVSDCTGEVREGFADVGGVVVGFVAVLRGHGEELLVHSFEGVDSLLELNVIGGELGLRECSINA